MILCLHIDMWPCWVSVSTATYILQCCSVRNMTSLLVLICMLGLVLCSYQDSSKWPKQKNKAHNYKQDYEGYQGGASRGNERRGSESGDEKWNGKQKDRRESSRRTQEEEPLPMNKQHCQKRDAPATSQQRGEQQKRGSSCGDKYSSAQPQSDYTYDDPLVDEPMTSEFPQCQRHAHDPNKLAKCERKVREKQEYLASLPQSAFPLCQPYVSDPYKLSICEQKASELSAKSQAEQAQAEPKSYPQCDRFVYDPYKLAKCQAEAKTVEQFMSQIPSSSKPIHPQCQSYAYDPYKLSICEEKVNELAQRQTATNSPNEQTVNPSYLQCERFLADPYKLAKCEREAKLIEDYHNSPPTEAEKHDNPIYLHCQKYSYDPFKLAKCESKAKYWISVINQDVGQSGGEQASTHHPQCEQYAYDPYKLAKCEYKIKKYSSYLNVHV
ncbi:hypothetical protein B566_EDAN005231 [Ephemera danica]|nr:hypothetical protein B566_EDAN005231 [Ephemera danica]